MMRQIILFLTLILAVLLTVCAGEQAKKKNPLPPYKITADEMEIDLNQKTQVYAGNVIFKTNYNTTKLTCDKIMADSNNAKSTSMVKATGNVKVTMTTVPAKKENSPMVLSGEAPIITYFTLDNEVLIKMESADLNGKKVLPILTSVDKETGEKNTVTGNIIIFNQKTGKLTVKGGTIEGGEDKLND